VESLHVRSSAITGMPIIQEQKFENLHSVLTKMSSVQFPWIVPEQDDTSEKSSPEIQNLIDNFDDIVKAVTGRSPKKAE